jgi:AcrR family transcriptional regulator
VAAAAASEELTVAMRGFWTERMAASTAIVERAVERGEVPADVDATLVIESLIGPLWVRLLLTGGPIDDEVADKVADLVVAGVAAPRA